MLNWAVTFLVVGVVAAVLGLGGIAATATDMAKVLFVISIVLFLVSWLFGRVKAS